MKILCHRGYWSSKNNQNTIISFQKAFNYGFGVETDIRDYACILKVSHDPTNGGEIDFEDVLKLYLKAGNSLPLALNVKADGLQELAAGLFAKYNLSEYFFFDMSVPDMLTYHKRGLRFFTRKSDIEPEALLIKEASGVWLDLFYSDWIRESDVSYYLNMGKQVCLVSPELHKRDHRAFWDQILEWDIVYDDRLMICTDLPVEAREYFSSDHKSNN